MTYREKRRALNGANMAEVSRELDVNYVWLRHSVAMGILTAPEPVEGLASCYYSPAKLEKLKVEITNLQKGKI